MYVLYIALSCKFSEKEKCCGRKERKWAEKGKEGSEKERTMNFAAKNHLKSLRHSILFVLSNQDLFLKMVVNLKYECMDAHYNICSIIEFYLSGFLQVPMILY